MNRRQFIKAAALAIPALSVPTLALRARQSYVAFDMGRPGSDMTVAIRYWKDHNGNLHIEDILYDDFYAV